MGVVIKGMELAEKKIMYGASKGLAEAGTTFEDLQSLLGVRYRGSARANAAYALWALE